MCIRDRSTSPRDKRGADARCATARFDTLPSRGVRCRGMTHLRRVLGPATAIWLLCQFGAVASVPVTLWTSAADPHTEECTCGHDAGAMCPMHHKPAGRPARCAMQAANSSGTAVLTMVVGVAGLTSEPTRQA